MIAASMSAITSTASALVTPAAGGEERELGSGTWASRWNSRSEPHRIGERRSGRNQDNSHSDSYGRWASRASARSEPGVDLHERFRSDPVDASDVPPRLSGTAEARARCVVADNACSLCSNAHRL